MCQLIKPKIRERCDMNESRRLKKRERVFREIYKPLDVQQLESKVLEVEKMY